MIFLKTNFLKNYKDVSPPLFLFVKNREHANHTAIINQETIHAAQQKECFLILFYIWNGIHCLIQLLKVENHLLAYRNIVFEREAYFHESHLEYLKNRKLFSFLKMYRKKHAHGVTF
ncbi:MAG: hypothetical protein QMB11_08540 [Nonlabens sp.]|jgi:hypothetical protein|uniref:hypothetical protein n=1 Tax=Nonlabens sp. TaxID=1888209 RepID=UPI0035A745F3